MTKSHHNSAVSDFTELWHDQLLALSKPISKPILLNWTVMEDEKRQFITGDY